MAATIIERPLGHKLSTSADFTIINSGGYAGFTDSLSLSTGDFIFVSGFVEDYNGFWYVEKSAGIVYLKQNSGTARVDFIVSTNVTVYKTLPILWNCVHLPIIYKIKSTLFPFNGVDPIRIVGGLTGLNGYTQLNLTGALTDPRELEYVNVNYSPLNDSNYIEAPFQIIKVLSTSSIVVNIAWPNSFGYYSVQKYYNNYHVKVNLYAGLNPFHTWTGQKPYELAATLKFIPDHNNEVIFSVNEILKSYIEIRNNTLLGTLPNNIDFFTQFYITFLEAFDVSEFPYDITINVDEGELINDKGNFEGVASNSILEFKNRYSGYLSDYLVDDSLTLSKFLTLFETPTIFASKYFDISFITNFNIALYLKKDYLDFNGVILRTDIEPITDYDKGLYRIDLSHNCEFTIPNEQQYLIYTFESTMEGWFNTVDGINPDSTSPPIWSQSSDNGGSLKLSTLTSGAITSIIRKSSIVLPSQESFIKIKWQTSFPLTNSGLTLAFSILNSSNAFIYGPINLVVPLDGNEQESIINITSSSVWLNADAFLIQSAPIGAKITGDIIHINSFEVTTITGTTDISDQVKQLQIQLINGSLLSEVKTFNINCNCENHSLYLTWLNNLGGFDYWNFTDGSDFIRNIKESGETKKNIFRDWPKSYGENASEIRKQTYKISNKGILVRAQHLTLEELQAIEYIKSSILVEIMLSRSDRRRVIIDQNSWTSYKDIDKLYTLSFTLEYTNDIPVQKL